MEDKLMQLEGKLVPGPKAGMGVFRNCILDPSKV